MSALDDLIARDKGASPSALNALMARDAAMKPVVSLQPKPQPSTLTSGMMGAAHGFGSVALGAQQLLGHALQSAGNLGQPQPTLSGLIAGQQPLNLVQRAGDWLVNDAKQGMARIDAENAQYAQPHPTANALGDVGGSMVPFFGPLGRAIGAAGAATGNVAAKIPMVGKLVAPVVNGATQGLLGASTAPVTGDGDYWNQKLDQITLGAGVGGGLGGAVGLIGGATNMIKPMVAPRAVAAQTFGKVATNGNPQDMATAVNALRMGGKGLLSAADEAAQEASTAGGLLGNNSGEIVPGSRPTLAELAPSPDIVRIQRTLGNRPELSGLFNDRLNANNAARWNVIQGVAGSDDALKAAIAARKDNAAPRIDSLLTHGNPVETDPVLAAIKKTQQSPFGVDPVINRGLSDTVKTITARAMPTPDAGPIILDANGNPLNAPPPQPTRIMPDQLDEVRQNLRNFISDNASNGAVASKQEAGLIPIKNALTDAIESANPGYRAHLAMYAQDSVPVNTMEAGQSMVADLVHRADNTMGDPLLRLDTYNGALKRALGNAEYGIDPQAETALKAVQDDLQRQSRINSLASAYGGGSATVPNSLANDWLGQRLYGGGDIGDNAVEKLPYGVGGVAKVWNQLSTQRSAAALADMFLNPTTSGADALQRYYSGSAPDPATYGLLSQLPVVPSSISGLLSQ